LIESLLSTNSSDTINFYGLAASQYEVLLSYSGDPTLALYGGNISVKAVPEPETYGMLLAGLAMPGMV